MRLLAAGRALGIAATAGLGAGAAVVALGQLGLVAVGVAAREALAQDGHHGQAVGLGLGGDMGGAGQEGNRGGGLEEHLDGFCFVALCVCVLIIIARVRARCGKGGQELRKGKAISIKSGTSIEEYSWELRWFKER